MLRKSERANKWRTRDRRRTGQDLQSWPALGDPLASALAAPRIPAGQSTEFQTSARRHVIASLHSLWQSRNLILNLVRRDLSVRYKSTLLGFFWSFAKPLAYMGIYHIVFGEIIHLSVRQNDIPYAFHVLVALLPWTFFQGACGDSMGSILANANLIKKVKTLFPSTIVVILRLAPRSEHAKKVYQKNILLNS